MVEELSKDIAICTPAYEQTTVAYILQTAYFLHFYGIAIRESIKTKIVLVFANYLGKALLVSEVLHQQRQLDNFNSLCSSSL